MSREDFNIGEYIVYVNGEQYELGRIKSIQDDGAFVAYHEGETGAKTPYDLMHKLINSYAIKESRSEEIISKLSELIVPGGDRNE